MAEETLRLVIENIVKEKRALAEMQAQIGAADKAVDHFGDTLGESEQEYQKLMRVLERGKGPAVAKAALERLDRLLKTGKINAQQYGVAAEALAVRTGRISPQAKAAADRLQQLEEQFAKGKISAQKYAEGIDDVGKELGELEGEQKKTGSILESSWAKVAVGIGVATAALAAMKKVYDFAKEGAQISRLRDSFEQLGNSERDLEILRKASLNTISDQNLMLATNKAQLLGVSDNVEDLAALLEVAAVRGRAMGLTTTAAFSDIVTGVGRLSPMILDNLGIVTGGQKVYDDYAKTLGVTADKLDDVQKRQALVNLIISQSGELGPLLSDQATRLEQLEVGFENFFNTLKEGFADAFVGTISNIDSVIGGPLRVLDALKEHQENMNEAVLNGSVSYEEYRTELERASQVAKSASPIMKDMVDNAIEPLTVWTINQTRAQRESNAAALSSVSALDGRTRSTHAAREAVEKLTNEEIEQLAVGRELIVMQAALTGSIGEQREEFASSQGEMIGKREQIINQLARLRNAHGSNTAAIGELTGELNEVNTALADNAAAHEEAVARQIFAWAMQRAAVGGTTAEEMKLLQQVGTQLGIFDEATTIAIDGVNLAFDRLDAGGALDDVAEDLQQIVDTASAIPTDVVMNVLIRQSGVLPEGFATGGATTRGGAVAGKHGLDEIVGPGFSHSRNGGKLFSAESGERVIIESVGQRGASSAGGTVSGSTTIEINNYFTVASDQDAEDAARIIARIIGENQS